MAVPWAEHRERAEFLRARHAHAAEVLTLYLALLDVWEETWAAVRSRPPESLARWAARCALPRVVAVTVAHGPAPLAGSLARALDEEAAEKLLAAWLDGVELAPVKRYLARASLCGALAADSADDPPSDDDRHCPRCAGPPQLSFRADTGDRLVSGGRRLLCARCGHSWSYSGSACAGCGESAGRTVHSERQEGPRVGRVDSDGAVFPHLRVEACTGCRRYLIDVDLGRDPRAVPEVDELTALPLDLYAAEHGLTKITPNVMGF
ncbi:formate dehydrogenase accessory protein FdhE [Streptomyces sp. NPDC050803]|uniref:formate dehydrogenase accessory protein FdhE domain-containing protein n=1 Tax=unclassified Streptomyces TaxID=2593676 RepID=UPI0034376453